MNPLSIYTVFVLLVGLFSGRAGSDAVHVPLIPVDLPSIEASVIDDRRNEITDSTGHLRPFFERLAALKIAPVDDGTQVVPVVHLGDSHVQAGFLTGTVMRNFHADFGNPGRGLITPLKLAKTNEPFDYAIRSESRWLTGRLAQRTGEVPLGIGGMGLSPMDTVFTLTVATIEKTEDKQYGFNRVNILHGPSAPAITPHLEDSSFVRLVTRSHDRMTSIRLPETVTEVDLKGFLPPNRRDATVIYGVVLENGHNGVLYHATGINGTQYLHWAKIEELGEQAELLRPSLIILSMGTNESLGGRSFKKENLWSAIDTVVHRLRGSNPEAVFLLTTPAECYVRQRSGGPRMS